MEYSAIRLVLESRPPRNVCPSLYHCEDAISSKAHEILIAAKSLQPSNARERERMLGEAVNMCKDIAGE